MSPCTCGAAREPGRRDPYCRECRSLYMRRYRQTPNGRFRLKLGSAKSRRRLRHNRQMLNLSALSTLKLDLGCADCGYNAHPEGLDFDHVRGEKRFTVSQLIRLPIVRLLEEIEKCEVVCATCHRVRTADRRVSSPVPWSDSGLPASESAPSLS